jgi:serine protease
MTQITRHIRAASPAATAVGRAALVTLAAAAATLALGLGLTPASAGAAGLRTATASAAWAPHRVIVGYTPRRSRTSGGHTVVASAASAPQPPIRTVVKSVPGRESVAQALRRLRGGPGVAYAYPDYVAHSTGAFFPDDPGTAHRRRGWELMQWNMLAGAGVDAPQAWANLLADERAGGKGVTVAVLDTGVAYRDWGRFRISPDFRGGRFVAPYDFIAHNRYPLDRNGHGTFVAGAVAERTNNGVGLTGVAYGASIMPVRVLNERGEGAESTIAQGIRYAVDHGARVINLSLEFVLSRVHSASQIPLIVRAVDYARRHRVVVVAAAGNDEAHKVAFPARVPGVISVGATTKDGCQASYSNAGPSLDLVAPGGGDDAAIASDPACHPNRALPPIYQLTLSDPPFAGNPGRFGRFGYPGYYIGTSMAAPEVSAVAALVIASRVLGPRPTPAQVLRRLQRTATRLPAGATARDDAYGYGLVDAGTATARPPTASR